jgi:hypothetical protein
MTTKISIGPRTDVEEYRMRSVVGGYRGDKVHHHDREINGTRYRFTHIRWGDGDVTLIVRTDDSSEHQHRWDYAPKRCENNCGAPIQSYEDFCGQTCWTEWHRVNEPEVLAALDGPPPTVDELIELMGL